MTFIILFAYIVPSAVKATLELRPLANPEVQRMEQDSSDSTLPCNPVFYILMLIASELPHFFFCIKSISRCKNSKNTNDSCRVTIVSTKAALCGVYHTVGPSVTFQPQSFCDSVILYYRVRQCWWYLCFHVSLCSYSSFVRSLSHFCPTDFGLVGCFFLRNGVNTVNTKKTKRCKKL